MNEPETVSIILPAKNELEFLKVLLPKLKQQHSSSELLVVDDGSDDGTAEFCRSLNVQVLRHPYAMGNGAAIKAGAKVATSDILIFMDADGQHDADDIPRLLEKMQAGYAMVVGARNHTSQASWPRRLANIFYNYLASFMTGYKIADLTSGFRAVKRKYFIEFLYLLPNGFSYPTTITMAFFRSGLPVTYIPIRAGIRKGKSHINILKDGLRFALIILKIGALFSPMRLFLPIGAGLFITGIGYYIFTYLSSGRFTNMGVLLLLASVIIGLMGIIAEQITALYFMRSKRGDYFE